MDRKKTNQIEADSGTVVHHGPKKNKPNRRRLRNGGSSHRAPDCYRLFDLIAQRNLPICVYLKLSLHSQQHRNESFRNGNFHDIVHDYFRRHCSLSDLEIALQTNNIIRHWTYISRMTFLLFTLCLKVHLRYFKALNSFLIWFFYCKLSNSIV